MQYQEAEPPEAFQNAIAGFWYSGRDFGELPSGFEVVPDGYAEIIY